MKASHIISFIIALGMIAFGSVYPVPEKYVNVSSLSSAYHSNWNENKGAEYIGADAYNYQIEASLKAGYVSGVISMKAIFFVGGMLLLCLTSMSCIKCSNANKQTELLTKLSSNAVAQTTQTQQIQQLAEQFKKHLEKADKDSFSEKTKSSEENEIERIED